MINQMMTIPRRVRNSITLAAGARGVIPLEPWDRIEGEVGVVALRLTVPAASVGDAFFSMQVGEGNPVSRSAVSTERAAGSGPQIEDPVYRASGVQGNRIFIPIENIDGANPVTITFDIEVLNRYSRARMAMAQ